MSDQKERATVSSDSINDGTGEVVCLRNTHTTAGNSLTTDAQVLPVLLGQHGAQVSIPWFTNHLTKQRQCRYVIPDKSLIVDIFENERQKLKISMHNLTKWVSPSDSLMPRFAKTLAFAISAAGVRCKYQQSSLAKYEKGVGDVE